MIGASPGRSGGPATGLWLFTSLGLRLARGVAIALLALLAVGSGAASARAPVSPVERLISKCPSRAQVAAINAKLAIAFESDPSVGTLVCRASNRSVNLTRLQERVYQALLVMKAMRFSRPLPWTNQNLYTWFVTTVHGIRFRGDIPLSFCCEPANVIDILVSPTSAELLTNRWLDPQSGVGLEDLVALLVHEARHNNGKPHTCGADDQTLSELGAWGVQYYLELWEALYSGSFLTSPDQYPSFYRDHALGNAESLLTRFCTLPTSDLSLEIKPPLPNRARRGKPITYTYTARNAGPDAADNVFVYTPVPIGTRFVRATPGRGSCSHTGSGPVACALGRIATGATVSVRLTLTVDRAIQEPVITNQESSQATGAYVTSPERDPNSTNNAATFSTPVSARARR